MAGGKTSEAGEEDISSSSAFSESTNAPSKQQIDLELQCRRYTKYVRNRGEVKHGDGHHKSGNL
jgi:hypothetical protein